MNIEHDLEKVDTGFPIMLKQEPAKTDLSTGMTLTSEHIESDTRERIVAVAERLFREIGYQKTTVADIAKTLRMSPANVYRFFSSKNAIVEAICQRFLKELEEKAWATARAKGPAARRLERR